MCRRSSSGRLSSPRSKTSSKARGPQHEGLQLPSDALSPRRSRSDRAERLCLGHVSQPDLGPGKGAELYHEYLDQMEFADKLGFDGVCLNEHHQTAYGMMPIPGVLAGALARPVKRR